MQSLVRYLTHPAGEVCVQAAIENMPDGLILAKKHIQPLSEQMLRLLHDPVERIRQAAMGILERIDSPESYRAIISKLTDTSSHVRSAAADILAKAGKTKVIPQEHPNIHCRSIDVVLPEGAGIPTGESGQGNSVLSKLTDQLLTELTAKPSDQVVAYRGNYRWIQTFEPIRLEKPDKKTSRLKKGGVYLITGGFGGIGLVLSEHLAGSI
ncbi:MAG: hypothetical protein GY749_03985 [Desulfobacteraceae bacterium]|nr:hypothetical protein [Desulfobacteraceae bacterium]